MNLPAPRFFPLHASGKPAKHALSPDALGGLNHLECGSHPGPWYCAQYHPGQLLLAAANLRRQGFTFHAPLEELPPSPRAPEVRRWRPLVPGYIFLSFDLLGSPWQRLFNTYGMKRVILSAGEAPLEIPRPALQAFLTPSEPFTVAAPQPGTPAQAATPAMAIKTGTALDIVSGPFAGNRGVCTLSAKNRIKLLVAIMGGEVEVSVQPHQVAPVREG